MGQNVEVMTVTDISNSRGWSETEPSLQPLTCPAYRSVFEVLSKTLHGIGRNLHVVEHPLQLLRELVTTFDFELCQHATLRIIRNRSAEKQTLGEVILIITLERVLFGNVSENRDRLIQDRVDLDICFLDENMSSNRS